MWLVFIVLAPALAWAAPAAAQTPVQPPLIEQAKQALDAGRLADATALLEQTQQTSSDCEIPFLLGAARYRMGQDGAAIVAFQSATKCDPERVESWMALGDAYLRKSDDNRALKAYEAALARAPERPDLLGTMASLYLRHDMNTEAQSVLERLVALRPEDANAKAALGASYAAQSRHVPAEEQFHAALELEPENASALTGLGNVYLKTDRAEAAVEVLERAVSAAPDSFEPAFLLGSAYNRLGRNERALEELQRAVGLNGQDAEVYYHLARVYSRLGHLEQQKAALDRFTFLKRETRNETDQKREAERLIVEAKPLVDAGNLPGAAVLLEQARKLDPGNARILFRLGGLYYDLRDYDSARGHTQQAIDLAPAEWLYRYLMGLIERDAGRIERAREQLETAARLNPQASEPKRALEEMQAAR